MSYCKSIGIQNNVKICISLNFKSLNKCRNDWLKLCLSDIFSKKINFSPECAITFKQIANQWAVNYTSPQSFIITFLIRWLNNFEDLSEF